MDVKGYKINEIKLKLCGLGSELEVSLWKQEVFHIYVRAYIYVNIYMLTWIYVCV